MDARINPAAALGLKEGDVHVIRNAGGRASDDAIRSLVISHKLLGTKEWFVVHHTDCGMEYFSSPQLATLLEGSLATASIVADATAPKGVTFKNVDATGGSAAGHNVHWLHIENQEASVKEDVTKIASHELVAVRSPHVDTMHTHFSTLSHLLSTRTHISHRQPGIPVHGYIYDVKTGKINHVVSAVTRA